MSWSAFDRIYGPTNDSPIESDEVPDPIDYHLVWTLVDGGDSCYVIPGWHFVNRLGYYVTERPWAEADDANGLVIKW